MTGWRKLSRLEFSSTTIKINKIYERGKDCGGNILGLALHLVYVQPQIISVPANPSNASPE